MDSENPADQARAVYLMLLVTHPEIEGDWDQKGEPFQDGYLFWVDITFDDHSERAAIWIIIEDEFLSAEGWPAHTSLRGYLTEEGDVLSMERLTVYQAAFQSYAHLYHVVGHEGCHVYDLVRTNGDITDWELELNAYKWNLDHAYNPIPYPWDIGELIRIVKFLTNPFIQQGPAVPV